MFILWTNQNYARDSKPIPFSSVELSPSVKVSFKVGIVVNSALVDDWVLTVIEVVDVIAS